MLTSIREHRHLRGAADINTLHLMRIPKHRSAFGTAIARPRLLGPHVDNGMYCYTVLRCRAHSSLSIRPPRLIRKCCGRFLVECGMLGQSPSTVWCPAMGAVCYCATSASLQIHSQFSAFCFNLFDHLGTGFPALMRIRSKGTPDDGPQS